MSVFILKVMLVIGIVGHAVNMYCDRILSVFPNGKLTLADITDTDMEGKMAKLLEGVSATVPMRSAILGAFSLLMESFGYLAISAYVYEKSHIFGMLLSSAILMFIVIGTAHHVKYGLVEWIFIKMGRTDEAKSVMMDLYGSAPITRICYAGYFIFIAVLIAAILTGVAGLSLWMVIFTILPVFIVLAPFRIMGTLHISAIISMLAWLIVL